MITKEDLLKKLEFDEFISTPLMDDFNVVTSKKGDRRELWEIYSRITHYNEDLQYIHRSKMIEADYKVPPDLQQELDTFSNEIQVRINEILEKKGK